jgi:CRP-like cAMP-binding protein
MTNILARKLEGLADLSLDDRALLDEALRRTRLVERKMTLVHEGDRPETLHLIVDGFACRSKHMPDGGRQIVAYLLPGDFCDLQAYMLDFVDDTVTTLSDCLVAEIPRHTVAALLARPAIAAALWRTTLTDTAVLREWLANNGRREGEKRIAHLICELYVRLRGVGLVDGHAFHLPLSQEDIADAAGLSTVHVNRCLQALRAEGLISLKGGALTILDPTGLARLSGFKPDYLRAAKGQPEGLGAPHQMAAASL